MPTPTTNDTTALDTPFALPVKAYLVTYDFKPRSHTLQADGHPKWREVELSMPELGRGWLYYRTTANEIRNCMAAKAAPPKPRRTCSQQDRVLALCE